MKSVICPGTFDPITLGHENMIRRAAALFDCVYVAVLDNIDKKTVFTMNERMHFAESVFLLGQHPQKIWSTNWGT